MTLTSNVAKAEYGTNLFLREVSTLTARTENCDSYCVQTVGCECINLFEEVEEDERNICYTFVA